MIKSGQIPMYTQSKLNYSKPTGYFENKQTFFAKWHVFLVDKPHKAASSHPARRCHVANQARRHLVLHSNRRTCPRSTRVCLLSPPLWERLRLGVVLWSSGSGHGKVLPIVYLVCLTACQGAFSTSPDHSPTYVAPLWKVC